MNRIALKPRSRQIVEAVATASSGARAPDIPREVVDHELVDVEILQRAAAMGQRPHHVGRWRSSPPTTTAALLLPNPGSAGRRDGDDACLTTGEVNRVLVLVEPGVQPAGASGPHRSPRGAAGGPAGCRWESPSPGSCRPRGSPGMPGSGPSGIKIRNSTSPPVASSPTCQAPQRSAMYRMDRSDQIPPATRRAVSRADDARQWGLQRPCFVTSCVAGSHAARCEGPENEMTRAARQYTAKIRDRPHSNSVIGSRRGSSANWDGHA